MRTPARKSNTRASARAARLEMEKARLEAERIATYGPVEPTPEPPPIQEPVMAEPSMPSTPAEATPLEVPEGDLATLVHEINTRYALAERNERVAEDHRLVMAIQLAKAKTLCEEAKIPFKAWAEKHLSQTYQTARKMAAIGASPNPRDALEAMRSKTAAAMKKSREQRAIAAPPPAPVSRETPTPAGGDTGLRVVSGVQDVLAEKPPLSNDRLLGLLASVRVMQVPEIQMLAIESLQALEKAPAIEAIEKAGFTVLDTRVSVSG